MLLIFVDFVCGVGRVKIFELVRRGEEKKETKKKKNLKQRKTSLVITISLH